MPSPGSINEAPPERQLRTKRKRRRRRRKKSGNSRSGSTTRLTDTSDADKEISCIVCTEVLDSTDIQFNPCQCSAGNNVCVWCFNEIVKEGDGRCPACRRPYSRDVLVTSHTTVIEPLAAQSKGEKAKQRKAKKDRVEKSRTFGAEKASHLRYLTKFRVRECENYKHGRCAYSAAECFDAHGRSNLRRMVKLDASDPCGYNYKPTRCQYFNKGSRCPQGTACPYAHTLEESIYHPLIFKTQKCTYGAGERGRCEKNGAHCTKAHGSGDVRTPANPWDLLKACRDVKQMARDMQRNKEFFMHEYKVTKCRNKNCRNKYTCAGWHHEGERRRNPALYPYSDEPCPDVKVDGQWSLPSNCSQGERCPYSHTLLEQMYHPQIYKTSQCINYSSKGGNKCKWGAYCTHAHGEDDVRSPTTCDPEPVQEAAPETRTTERKPAAIPKVTKNAWTHGPAMTVRKVTGNYYPHSSPRTQPTQPPNSWKPVDTPQRTVPRPPAQQPLPRKPRPPLAPQPRAPRGPMHMDVTGKHAFEPRPNRAGVQEVKDSFRPQLPPAGYGSPTLSSSSRHSAPVRGPNRAGAGSAFSSFAGPGRVSSPLPDRHAPLSPHSQPKLPLHFTEEYRYRSVVPDMKPPEHFGISRAFGPVGPAGLLSIGDKRLDRTHMRTDKCTQDNRVVAPGARRSGGNIQREDPSILFQNLDLATLKSPVSDPTSDVWAATSANQWNEQWPPSRTTGPKAANVVRCPVCGLDSKPRNQCLIPCGHLVCKPCANRTQSTCFICNNPVSSVQTVIF